jgi:hypothetical protein
MVSQGGKITALFFFHAYFSNQHLKSWRQKNQVQDKCLRLKPQDLARCCLLRGYHRQYIIARFRHELHPAHLVLIPMRHSFAALP